jgi:hypothetical protein
LCGIFTAGVLGSPEAAAQDAGGAGVVEAQEMIRLLNGDRATNLSGFTVTGDVDLGSLERIARPLRCQECRFTGSLIGTDLILERIVDFSGSSFLGPVDFSAALFRDRTGFEGVTFARPANFGSTRFLAEASFARSSFGEEAVFDRVQFGAGAVFTDATFEGNARFPATQFASVADYSGAVFNGRSDFTASGFAKRMSFARAEFTQLAEFRAASFSGGANLGVNRFGRGFNFEEVTAGGSTEFLGAVLLGEGALNNFSSTGLLALDGIRLVGSDTKLFLDRMAVDRLTMDVDQIGFVQGRAVQKEVLKLVEAGGRKSGDLALANRARFQFLDLEGREKTGLPRLVDRVFFRNIGGYLVRPLNPLIALAFLVLVGGLIRSGKNLRSAFQSGRNARSQRAGPRREMKHRLHDGFLAAEKAVGQVVVGIAKTMKVAVRRKPEHIELADPEQARAYLGVGFLWGEFIAYKLVIALFVLALGNSNSTVRQLLDAVTG